MRRRLLLILIVAITASLGADCGGGSSSSSSAQTSLAQSEGFEVISNEDEGAPGVPAPEPSAALIFGAGLFAAYLATRRR